MIRRVLLALACSAPLWATAYTSASKCSSGCNWSDSSAWSPSGVPGNGDTVSIANGHTVTVDQDVTVGNSGAPFYSYVSSVTVTGAAGYTTCTTATFSGGTRSGSNDQGATCSVSGGVPVITLAFPRRWYVPASVAPTVTTNAAGGSGAVYTVVWRQGGGTAAINFNATGKVVNAGHVLRVRGDLIYTAAAGNSLDTLIMSAGASLIFDSSLAAPLSDGSRPIYSYGQQNTNGYRQIHADCPTARCSIGADAGGNVATISSHDATAGSGIFLHYVDVTRLGSAIDPWLMTYPYTNTGVTSWDIQFNNFTNCGGLYSAGNAGGAYNFNFSRNTMSGTLTSMAMYLGFASRTTGSSTVSGNVIDVALFANGVSPNATPDVAIDDNYAGNGIWGGAGTGPWSSHKRNFVSFNAMPAISYRTYGDINDSYYFLDQYWANWHCLQAPANVSVKWDGLIWGYGDGLKNGDDSGELFNHLALTQTTHYYVQHSIALPNAAGYAYATLASTTGASSYHKEHYTHNTWFGGMQWSGATFGMSTINESSPSPTGTIPEFASNIAWNPNLPGYISRGYPMVVNVGTATNPDVLLPAGTDYNWAWNIMTVTGPNNQGRGYQGNWSVTPGAHEDALRGDPRFVDYQRSVELFDSKYLGNSYTPWSAASSYSYGDFVTSTDAAAYWGLPVNFRCVNAGGCPAGVALKPGVPLTAWRTWWEWASLYQLRQNLGVNYRVFPLDGAISPAMPATCTPDNNNIVCVLEAWIRRGYTPQNPALYQGGMDGTDIGAVPMDGSRLFPDWNF